MNEKRKANMISELSPCSGCAIKDLCKYMDGVQVNFNPEIFKVTIECKFKQHTKGDEGTFKRACDDWDI